jgi:hypothetical protein
MDSSSALSVVQLGQRSILQNWSEQYSVATDYPYLIIHVFGGILANRPNDYSVIGGPYEPYNVAYLCVSKNSPRHEKRLRIE